MGRMVRKGPQVPLAQREQQGREESRDLQAYMAFRVYQDPLVPLEDLGSLVKRVLLGRLERLV